MSARKFNGGSAASTLSGGITSSATTISVTDASTWPSTGAFSIVIDRGLTGEEKLLIGSRSGNVLTVTTRGYDGTTGAAHANAAAVECCATATDFQEANDHINATAAVHGLAGTVVGTSDTQTLTNKTIVAEAASTIGGVSGTSLAADRAAWTAYTPTTTNTTGAVAVGRYKQIGKTVYLNVGFTAGSVTATAIVTISLPAGMTGKGVASGVRDNAGTFSGISDGASLYGALFHGATAVEVRASASGIAAGTALAAIVASGVIEIQ